MKVLSRQNTSHQIVSKSASLVTLYIVMLERDWVENTHRFTVERIWGIVHITFQLGWVGGGGGG